MSVSTKLESSDADITATLSKSVESTVQVVGIIDEAANTVLGVHSDNGYRKRFNNSLTSSNTAASS
jgi:hypothetical protein